VTRSNHRLFVAFDVPEEHRLWLHDQTRELRDGLSAARWIPLENQHVTLKFLGPIAAEKLDAVGAACTAAARAIAPGPLRLGPLGAFPNVRRARVLWAGIADPGGVTTALAAALDRHLEPLGVAPESRGYTPHLTLARLKTPTSLHDLPELPVAPEAFPLQEIVLYRSHLSPRGSTYEALARAPLA